MDLLEELSLSSWKGSIPHPIQLKAMQSLEEGKVLYLPSLNFLLNSDELLLLSPAFVDPTRKNISYELKKDRMGGIVSDGPNVEKLKGMLRRYALDSLHFLQQLFPHYVPQLTQARTSFRPTEIMGRKSSVRKDDTRLHVDAFPSSPTHGRRILRIFTNINPDGKPRVWRVGEPFENVVQKFAVSVPKPMPGSAALLKFLKITKDTRTPYDHYMLHIHNRMKEDNHYQKAVNQKEIHFPAGSSWITFTDQVSHAAMSGQHLLEQTFSLPPHALSAPSKAPLQVLERFFKRPLLLRR